jgi:hypothetical protein
VVYAKSQHSTAGRRDRDGHLSEGSGNRWYGARPKKQGAAQVAVTRMTGEGDGSCGIDRKNASGERARALGRRACGASRLSESRLMFLPRLSVLKIMRSQRNVQEYQNSFQFRSASHCRRDSCGLASVREENQRLQQTSKANEGSFMAAVDEIAEISTGLLRSLEPMHRRGIAPNLPTEIFAANYVSSTRKVVFSATSHLRMRPLSRAFR